MRRHKTKVVGLSPLLGRALILSAGLLALGKPAMAKEPSKPERERLAVMAFRIGEGLDPNEGRVLRDYLVSALNKVAQHRYTIVNAEDVLQVLDFQQRLGRGCSAKNELCFRGVSEVLESRFLAGGSVGRFQSKYLLKPDALRQRAAQDDQASVGPSSMTRAESRLRFEARRWGSSTTRSPCGPP